MIVRNLLKSDFVTLQGWFKKWNNMPLPIAIWSDYGFIAEEDGKLLGSVFMYPSVGAQIAFIGWMIGNPDTTQALRSQALDLVVRAAEECAKSLGYRMAMAVSGQEAVSQRLEARGYFPGNKSMIELFKNLEEKVS